MYIEDSVGNRYEHILVGGSDYVPCMQSGFPYAEWYKFPPAQTKNAIFTFFDDDAGIKIFPKILATAP